METIVNKDGELRVDDGGIPFSLIGKTKDGRYGLFVAKTEERIFKMDNVIRKKQFTAEETSKALGIRLEDLRR